MPDFKPKSRNVEITEKEFTNNVVKFYQQKNPTGTVDDSLLAGIKYSFNFIKEMQKQNKK